MTTHAARLPPGSDVVALLAREMERSRLAEALGRQRLRLADLADGVDEARLVEEMKAFDPDAATATLTELECQDEDLGQQEKDRYAERDRLQRKRGNSKAASAPRPRCNSAGTQRPNSWMQPGVGRY